MLAIFAHLALAYPLLFLICWFGEWFLAWYMLEREPRVSADDPKDIIGSGWMHLMHPITALVMFGLLPAACAALVFTNTAYVVERRLPFGRLAVRVLCLLSVWIGMIALIGWYPP